MDSKTKRMLVGAGLGVGLTLLDSYVRKQADKNSRDKIETLISEVRDEMATQEDDDEVDNTYSMQNYHNDMKHIEETLSKLSEPILLSIRDRAFGMLSTREFKELVDRVYSVEKAINKEDEE